MLMKAKTFSDVAFHSIPKCRRTNLFLCHNPQSVKRLVALLYEQDKTPRGNPPPWSHHPSKILSLSDSLLFCKSEGSFHTDPPPHLLLDSLFVLRNLRPKQSTFFSPSSASVLRRFDRFWYSSSPRIHEFSFAWECSVDMFFSWNASSLEQLIFWND